MTLIKIGGLLFPPTAIERIVTDDNYVFVWLKDEDDPSEFEGEEATAFNYFLSWFETRKLSTAPGSVINVLELFKQHKRMEEARVKLKLDVTRRKPPGPEVQLTFG